MRILCKSASQVPGHGVVRRGEHIDWPDGEEFPPQVLGNFVDAATGARLGQPSGARADEERRKADEEARRNAAEDAEKKRQAEKAAAKRAEEERKALIEKAAKVGRAKLEAKLEAENVPHDANLTAEQLATLLLRHQGAIK